MRHIGYIRVSTADQNTARQLIGVKLDERYEEKVSAKSIDRPELENAIKCCTNGDTFHVHSLDRLCRSGAGDALAIVERLLAKGTDVVFHKEGLHFKVGVNDITQELMLGILASVAKMERALINERRVEGIAAAKAAGKHIGRPSETKFTGADLIELRKTMSVKEVMSKTGLSKASVHRIIKATK